MPNIGVEMANISEIAIEISVKHLKRQELAQGRGISSTFCIYCAFDIVLTVVRHYLALKNIQGRRGKNGKI